MRPVILAGFASLVFVPSLVAQSFTTGPCDNDHQWTVRAHVCESRHATLPLKGGKISVAGENGGIEVIGEDRSDIALETQVSASAFSQDEARNILHDVHILTDGTIHAEGPRYLADRSWSVNFKLHVPRHVAAELETKNGGIRLSELDGALHAQTTNGGLTLTHLGGDVHASTTNGGVHVELAGNTWHGVGLDAHSVNGGIHVTAPGDYSAHLIAATVNGGAHINVPNANEAWRSRNRFEGNLGHGGPTLRMETTNGGITVN